MIEAPERIWDFWPHDGGNPVLWREPCPFQAEDAEVFEYIRADRIEELEAKIAKAVRFIEIVEKCGNGPLWDLARTALAELRGGNDE